MSDQSDPIIPPFGPENIDMSKLTVEELLKLKDAILEHARHTVDPTGTGFNPIMQGTMEGAGTWDWVAQDWRQWIEEVENLINVVSLGWRGVVLGILAGTAGIAAAQLYTTESGSRYAGATLLVAAGFAVWAGVTVIMGSTRQG